MVRDKNAIPITQDLSGKILHHSWGYDMTINEFFVIEEQTAKTVLARRIGTTRTEDHETPDPAKRGNHVVRFLAKPWRGGYLFVGGGISCTLHDGHPTYYNRND